MAEDHSAGHGDKEHKPHSKHGGHGHGGGHEEHEEGVAEWVVSFADNALLQMGFFVILLAMNLKEPTSGGVGGKEKFGPGPASAVSDQMLDMVIGVREAFNNPVNLDSSNPNDLPLIRRIIQRREGASHEDGPRGDRQNVESVRPTEYHRIGAVVSFDENGTTVDQTGREAAAAVAREIKGRRTIVEVRGHVSLAEAYKPVDKGMRLSFDRAMAVAQVLWESGVDREQVRIVAVGAADRATPVARDPQARRNNQRVEIIVTDEMVPADPFSGAAVVPPLSGGGAEAQPTAPSRGER